MDNKKPFKKLDIDTMKKKKQEQETLDAIMEKIDEQVDSTVVELLQEMGYPAKHNMTLEENQALQEELDKDNLEVQIEPEQKGDSYTVTIKLAQGLRILDFSLKND